MNKISLLIVLSIILLQTGLIKAQDPQRFNEQVNQLVNKEYQIDSNKKLLVFAGSSSFRMWKDVPHYFPEYNVINNGFGGSHFTDLLYYYDQLVVRFNPDILFIYEGDNDIAGNKKPGKVFSQARELAKRVKKDLPNTPIVFVSPKPSIARGKLRPKYIKLNRKLERYCQRADHAIFADMWPSMTAPDGRVMQDIFIEDGLHLNKKGYDIWGGVIRDILQTVNQNPE